jgi:hypothetical protein
MSYILRPIKFTFFRLFFVALLFATGLSCLVLVVMQHYFDFNIISANSRNAYDAIFTGIIISGLLSLFYGVVLLRIMTDRRLQKYDRRQYQAPIIFFDRRSGIDQRTGQPKSGPNQGQYT